MNPLTLIGLAAGIVLGFFIRYLFAKKSILSVESRIKQSLEEAKNKEKEILLSAEKKKIEIVEASQKERLKLLDDLKQREARVNKREEIIDLREKELLKAKTELTKFDAELKKTKEELTTKKEFLVKEVEKISGLKKEEALKILFEKIEKEHKQELLEKISKLINLEKEEVQKEALEIILTVLPKYSRSVVSEAATTIVSLPNDEMKGRIIGKEGRNIRHFENLTGVELIIDETPEVATLSSFDPVRREIARLALEKLVKDGRIHPAAIEESIVWAQEKIEEDIREVGKNAAYEVEIFDLPESILHLLGRLKFRTSYGQNVLQHSIEVALFSKMLAEELGIDKETAKKAGFLHDIGKSVDHQIEGTHLEISIKILQKYGVEEKVILAMRSHHETYPFASPEAYIVLAADALSARRLGARGETGEIYIKRLEELEKLAVGFSGVEKAYAISGGREIRVFIKAEEVNDLEMLKLAQNIARKIEKDLRYPGEIKVVAIREKRAVEYAK
jgi:ribonuclease Y